MSTTRFRPFDPGQMLLLRPNMRQWLPEDYLAYFILDVVAELDLSLIYTAEVAQPTVHSARSEHIRQRDAGPSPVGGDPLRALQR